MANASIVEVLDCWAATSASSVVSEAPRGFSGAVLRRVETTAGAFALRRWPSGGAGLPVARIRELHRWLAWLAEQGVAIVAVPLQSNDGSTIVERRGMIWQLEPWLQGTADFHSHPTDERLRSAFTALARLHLASDRYAPTDDGGAWFWRGSGRPDAVSERLAKLPRTTIVPMDVPSPLVADPQRRAVVGRMSSAIAVLAPRIAADLSRFMDVRVPLQPCLRDVWHDHVLFTGDEVTGIIDPSAAKTENVASDLSRLLGSFLGDSFDRWEIALAAYAAIRPLSADERRLIPLLDRSGVVLSACHWLQRLHMTEVDNQEQERVMSIAERLSSLASREWNPDWCR